jgi:hypothetical protein
MYQYITYQYDTKTSKWTALPAGGPIYGAGGGSFCGVGADGYLYAGDSAASSTIYRIKLE